MIRIDTGQLVALLGDLSHTAADPEAGAIAGVLLHSTQGHLGGNPGLTSLLAGTSTTGTAVGHTYASCTGVLVPTLCPIQDVKAAIAVLKPLSKKQGHITEIRRVDDYVTLNEDPDLFGEGLTLSFAAGDLEKYPHVWQVLTAPPAGINQACDDEFPNSPRTDIPPAMLAPFVKVGSRRREVLKVYRYHQWRRVLIQIGETYRGALTPTRYEDLADAEPPGDIYAPDLPEVVSADS